VLRTRLWTAAVALPAVIAMVLFAPAGLFSAFIAILAAWGLYEIGAMTHAGGAQALALAICGGVPAAFLLIKASGPWLAPALVIGAMAVLVIRVAATGGIDAYRGTGFVILGALWVGVLFPYFALLRNALNGRPLVVMMLLLVVASDSGAYFAGRSIGRIKLAARLSPNKTVEGALGGLAACVLAGLILRGWLAPTLSGASIVVLAIAVGLLAQIGDLAGSAFKRVAGVKDSGWIFPGHGGLLDRTCSLVFPAVFTYYYLR
jgi:phosphatidate cytidylyltransferase